MRSIQDGARDDSRGVLACIVLFVNFTFCLNTRWSFNREELVFVRATNSADLFHNFLLPSVEILDIQVKGALTFAHAVKHRRRKRSGALVLLCQHGHRTPLPGVFHSNVRSLCDKLDELQLLVGENTFLHLLFCVLCIHGSMD